jgi:hypothetical protein
METEAPYGGATRRAAVLCNGVLADNQKRRFSAHSIPTDVRPRRRNLNLEFRKSPCCWSSNGSSLFTAIEINSS